MKAGALRIRRLARWAHSPDQIRRIASSPEICAMSKQISEQHSTAKLISPLRVDYHQKGKRGDAARLRGCWRPTDLGTGKVELFTLAAWGLCGGMRIYGRHPSGRWKKSSARINGRFCPHRLGPPVRLSDRRMSLRRLVAWFGEADVCWITPARDGLNVWPREYGAPGGWMGCLVLSNSRASGKCRGRARQPLLPRAMGRAIAEAL